ncbi:MAG: helix-turn-helix domain-containing protein, partial [Gammaproteobacteria bacterium]
MLSHFGEALKARREKLGMPRGALAKQMGIKPGVLTSIEKCASLPDRAMLSTICAHLKVSEEELVLAAGVVPCWLEDLLRKHPRDILELFSSRFGSSVLKNKNDQNAVKPCTGRVLETELGKLYRADCVV